MLQVRAKATVEVERESNGVGLTTFRVEVWGYAPYDYVRIYKIPAKDDNTAAFEGLRRFQEEMEAKFSQQES